jgi:hypothetical protein
MIIMFRGKKKEQMTFDWPNDQDRRQTCKLCKVKLIFKKNYIYC